jgi:hypothetical protein
MARDGIKPWVSCKLPTNLKRSAGQLDPHVREAMRSKLAAVHARGYIEKGFIKNLTHVFPVGKADGDICLVYNCACSLVNEALWA